ncbi:hypothetical protein [Tenacibaculum discolor]|uniref:hypothetical protein n=1 Tax=Tenacibaculum discolor TaxID=361581 RepID=UPI0011C39BC2|nr:hypothetical protein [Tenacibaculum discolor]
MTKNKAPETAAVLESIPSWILRWGILIMAIIVAIVIILSIKLIHFQYKLSTNVHVESGSLFLSKTLNDEININEVEYILIGDSKPIRISDLNIVSNQKNIVIKIPSYYSGTFNVKDTLKIEVFQKKSLLEIIVGDIN